MGLITPLLRDVPSHELAAGGPDRFRCRHPPIAALRGVGFLPSAFSGIVIKGVAVSECGQTAALGAATPTA